MQLGENALRKRKKQSGQKKRALLAACVTAALLYAAPAYAGPEIAGETVDDKELGASATAPAPYVIAAGQTKTTWAGATQSDPVVYSKGVTIETGGTWRPMDIWGANTAGGILTIKKDATLDLSYKYANYSYDVGTEWKNLATSFNNYVNNAATSAATKTVLYDGAILKGTIYGNEYRTQFIFMNPALGEGETSATVRVKLRYDKSFFSGTNSGLPAGSWEAADKTVLKSPAPITFIQLKVRNTAADKANLGAVADKLNFVAENSYVDDALHKYILTSEIVPGIFNPGTSATRQYPLTWTATRTDLLSQGVFSAANAQLSMRNLWRMEDGLFWQRGADLRAADRLGRSEGADGAWAQIWRGKYDFDGIAGSSFGQSYNGIQVGYDKQREGNVFGGKLYTGLFLSLLNSNADFRQHNVISDNGVDKVLYSRSDGDLESKGIGLYTTWIGDKGHYLDFSVRGSKLSNNYKYFDSDNALHETDYGTWAYGAGVRYGYQKDLANGWYLEPQLGLSYGTMPSYSFTQDNNMRYNQDRLEMLTGRLGVTAGRNFTNGDKRGVLYAKAVVNHDFKEGGTASADALYLSGKKYLVGATLPMNTLAGKDTWYEFAVGANLQTGKDQNAFVELSRTAGGKVNTDWQVNAGLSWRFNGPSSQDHTAAIDRSMPALATAPAANPTANSTADAGQTPTVDEAAGAAPARQTEQTAVQAGQALPAEQSDRIAASEHKATAPDTTQTGSSEPGSFTLAPLVVEAARPDWEKKLSPGTVSVIHVPEYKGEMKNLPDLLQTVPGVYIQRLQGTGHYTVARVRGATGGEVNIYIDGVLVNSNADAAVDLSAIPVENVERIEVYRGYVPARFAGAPIGGAINIVTKKPQDTRGSISQGMRSFGGYTGNLELTAPVGSGSMLFAINRDQAKGDFRYKNLKLISPSNFEPETQDRHRLYNDYQKTDALLKWQDDIWFAKLTWKENKTNFPESAYLDFADMPFDEVRQAYAKWGSPVSPLYNQYRQRRLETTKTGFQFGRRQTAGNLEWGWKLDTSYQFKRAASSQTKNPSNNYFMTVDNEFRSRRYEGAIDGSWQVGDGHLVEFLFNASRETMDVDTHNLATWPPKVNSVGNDGVFYKKYFKQHYQTNAYHFQVQDTMTLNKSGNLFFTPLLRAQKMDMDVDLGDPDLNSWKYSYGLGLKKVQNEHWTFRGTYGTYYKFPNWYEIFGDGVNVKSRWEKYRNIQGQPQYQLNNFVERGTSWDVSANWQGKALKADTDVTLTYFNRDSKNLSSYSLDMYGWGYYTNLAAGKIQGVELENRMKWQRWDLLLAATWNDSVITQSSSKASLVTGPSWQQGTPFPWIPEWEYNVRLGYRFPGDKLSAFAEYHYLDRVANRGTAGSEGSTTYDSLGITNVGFKYDLNKRVKLTAGVNDLLNKGPNQLWRSWGPRSGTGGVTWIETGVGNVQYPQQGRTYYMTAQYFF
jgi:outer membrane autotransporter protein